MAHLKAVSAEDAKPDPAWIEAVDTLADTLRRNAEGVFAVVMTRDGAMEVFAAGDVPCDSIAGYSARVLASMANAE